MKFLKNAAVRATALLFFAAMISAVILWQAGVYDISFIKRPTPQVTDTDGTSGNGDSTSAPDSSSDPGTTEPPETDLPTDTTVSEEDAEKLLDLILSYADMKKDGWRISDGLFGRTSSVARLDFDTGSLKNKFSSRTSTESKTVLYQDSRGYWQTKTVSTKVASPSVRFYFGLILLDNGKTISVYNSDGKRLIRSFTGTLVYAKTDSGDPAVMIKNKYYGINENTGLTDEISADRIRFRALEFDYPSYFFSDTGLYPFSQYVDVLTEITTEPPTSEPPETDPPPTDSDSSPDTEPGETSDDTDSSGGNDPEPPETSGNPEPDPPETSGNDDTDPPVTSETDAAGTEPLDIPISGKQNEASEAETTVIDGKQYTVEKVLMWGYRDAAGNTVIEPQYSSAYDFSSEGIAAVVDFEDRVIFIDRTGKTVLSLIDNETVLLDPTLRVKVLQRFVEPISNGIESIGSFYLDRGYVMVRYIKRGTKSANVIVTENRLVAKNGRYFDIPSGYSLCGYSDGALLLEKNGSYGFMDLDGGWIAPAVYSSATPFVSGLSVVSNSDGKYGLINTGGEYVLPMYFDYISTPSSGIVAAYSEARGWEIHCAVDK